MQRVHIVKSVRQINLQTSVNSKHFIPIEDGPGGKKRARNRTGRTRSPFEKRSEEDEQTKRTTQEEDREDGI